MKKVIVISGGSSCLGKAIVQKLTGENSVIIFSKIGIKNINN